MIIEYDSKYEEDVKNLLVELQEYIASIDEEGYNILTLEFREKYFESTMKEVKNKRGKILLAKEGNKIIGLIIGLIFEEVADYDFKAPKRGRISELIVSKKCRVKGTGKKLMESMEKHLKSEGCKDILIEVFGYNDLAMKFYKKRGYKTRLFEVTKTL